MPILVLFGNITVPLNVGLARLALLFDKSKSLDCIFSLAPLNVNKFVEVKLPLGVVNTVLTLNIIFPLTLILDALISFIYALPHVLFVVPIVPVLVMEGFKLLAMPILDALISRILALPHILLLEPRVPVLVVNGFKLLVTLILIEFISYIYERDHGFKKVPKLEPLTWT